MLASCDYLSPIHIEKIGPIITVTRFNSIYVYNIKTNEEFKISHDYGSLFRVVGDRSRLLVDGSHKMWVFDYDYTTGDCHTCGIKTNIYESLHLLPWRQFGKFNICFFFNFFVHRTKSSTISYLLFGMQGKGTRQSK